MNVLAAVLPATTISFHSSAVALKIARRLATVRLAYLVQQHQRCGRRQRGQGPSAQTRGAGSLALGAGARASSAAHGRLHGRKEP